MLYRGSILGQYFFIGIKYWSVCGCSHFSILSNYYQEIFSQCKDNETNTVTIVTFRWENFRCNHDICTILRSIKNIFDENWIFMQYCHYFENIANVKTLYLQYFHFIGYISWIMSTLPYHRFIGFKLDRYFLSILPQYWRNVDNLIMGQYFMPMNAVLSQYWSKI